MHEPDFWTKSADAMELSIEGNRLIVQEIAELARDLCRRIGDAVHARLRVPRTHRQSPPV